jgi:hypothetical protein
MKKNHNYIWLSFIGLAIILGIYFFTSSQDGGSGASAGKGKTTVEKLANVPTQISAQLKRADAMRKALDLNDPEVTFYGRVIDQDDKPVEGAKVVGGAQYRTLASSGVRSYQTFTDANGHFVFPKVQGRDFGCEPWKEGYVYWPAKDQKGYTLSKLAPANERYVSDPKKPEIFRLWKNKGAEELLCGSLRFDVLPNKTPYSVDLKVGKQAKEKGDVVFWCRYTPLPEDTPSEERMIDWEFGIKVAVGGVIQTESSIPFEAPSGGYKEEWSYRIEKNDGESNFGRRTFYIKTAEGNYGVFMVQALYNPTSTECSTRIAWKLNPSGSRNLEPGKEKMLKKNSTLGPGEPLSYILLRGG